MSRLILSDFEAPQIEGSDCKYEDSYLLIEQEIDKDYSVTQDSTDWSFIYDNTQELLEKNTKDLKLASWWVYSSWKNKSWEGLETTFNIFIPFVEKFQSNLYPKSIKGKSNIINWLEDSLTNELINNEANKKLLTKPVEFYEIFLELDRVLCELLENSDGKFRKIINYLKPFYEDEQKKLTENEEKQNNIESKTGNMELLQIGTLGNDAEAIKLLNNTKKNLSLLSNYYRTKDFTDLKALRICRFLSWLETDGLPYADGKKTQLYAPSELEIDELNKLVNEEKYEEALSLAEEIIEVSPFWLDGHQTVCNIFEKTNNQNISNEVKNSLLSFVKTNEGILDFYFIDNIPFASPRVKKWIQNELEVKNEANSENDNKNNKKIEKIDELANSGKVKEAMQEIAKYYDNSTSVEEKFNWRLYHAQLAVEFNKKDIALALVEDLQKDIDTFCLDKWNPKLVSKVYTLILNSFSNIDIEADRLEQIYKRLCKTDISSAFEIKIS